MSSGHSRTVPPRPFNPPPLLLLPPPPSAVLFPGTHLCIIHTMAARCGVQWQRAMERNHGLAMPHRIVREKQGERQKKKGAWLPPPWANRSRQEQRARHRCTVFMFRHGKTNLAATGPSHGRRRQTGRTLTDGLGAGFCGGGRPRMDTGYGTAGTPGWDENMHPLYFSSQRNFSATMLCRAPCATRTTVPHHA